MRQSGSRQVGILLVAVLAVLALVGCGGVGVLGAIPLRDDQGFCVADLEGEQVIEGRFDAGAANAEFHQGFLLEGGLTGRELNQVILSYTAVEQSIAPLMEGLGMRMAPAAGHLGAGESVGLGLVLVPRDVASVLASTPELSDSLARINLVVEYRLQGGRSGTDDANLGPVHSFPVEVCNGCMVCPDGSAPTFPCGPGSPPMVCP